MAGKFLCFLRFAEFAELFRGENWGSFQVFGCEGSKVLRKSRQREGKFQNFNGKTEKSSSNCVIFHWIRSGCRIGLECSRQVNSSFCPLRAFLSAALSRLVATINHARLMMTQGHSPTRTVFKNAINPMKIAVKRNLKSWRIFQRPELHKQHDSHQLASL
jgi:hypothetical protein